MKIFRRKLSVASAVASSVAFALWVTPGAFESAHAQATQPAGDAPAAASADASVAMPNEMPDAAPVDYHKGYSLGAHNDYIFRWQEDYGYLSNPALSDDPFDPLKYIPLSADGKSWLTLNGSLRLMVDHNLTNVLNTPFGATNDFYSRATAGVDLHLGDHFRAYFEGIDGQYEGTSPVPGITTTELAIYNAFVEFMGKTGNTKYGVQIGRQQLWIGNSLMIGPNELTNIPTTQNGVHGYVDWGRGRLDLFDVMPTDYGQSGVGKTDTGVHLSGIYGSFDLPAYSLFGLPVVSTIDPFLFRFTSSSGTYYDASLALPSVGRPAFVTGADERNMVGVRYSGTVGAVDFDWTAAFQGGNFAGRPVDAWMFATSTGYAFNNLPYAPHVALQIDGASGGDSAQNGGALHTYQPLYVNAPYYSEALAVLPVNMIDVAPHFQIHPWPRFTAEAYWAFYWRQSLGDAIYGGPFGGPTYVDPYAGSAGRGSLYIGDQPTLAFRWRATKHVFVDLTLAYFRPAATLRSMGGKNTPWTLLFTNISF